MLPETDEMKSLRKRKTQRLFVALELPEDLLARLEALKPEFPGIPWTPRNNLHLTLRFIGNVPEEDIPGIRAALRTVRAGCFFLRVRGLGIFAQSRQTILWAGLEPSADLLVLKRRVDAALEGGPALAMVSGRFAPHITLSRMRKNRPETLRRFVGDHAETDLGKFHVISFALFRSELAPGGAVHSLEEAYPLFPA